VDVEGAKAKVEVQPEEELSGPYGTHMDAYDTRDSIVNMTNLANALQDSTKHLIWETLYRQHE
jgi:hypothetical protein